MRRFWVIIVAVTAILLRASAAEPLSVFPNPASEVFSASRFLDYSFILVSSDTTSSAPVISDMDFYRLSASVLFQVNKTNIRQDDPFFQRYRQEILPMINDSHLQFRRVYIRGAASPEGPYANNRRLGRDRTEALLAELKRDLKHQYLESDIELVSITEDYLYLCILMEENQDPDAAFVRSLCQNANWDEPACKKKLMAARGGSLWKRLLKEYFPQLRVARVILWFTEPDAQHSPMLALEPVPSMPARLAAACTLVPQTFSYEDQSEKQPRRHLIALRTNLVHDFFYMPNFGFAPSPNLQLEYYPLNGHWTYSLGVTWGTWRKWDQQKFWQVRDFQFEARRYFKGGGQFTGLYLGGYLHGDVYGIGLSGQKGWQGEGGGVGISLGYVLPLTKKGDLRMEFMLGVGAFVSIFDPYVYGNPLISDKDGFYYYDYLGSASEFKRRNHLFTWFGPTNLGIQLTYDIIYRKRKQVK